MTERSSILELLKEFQAGRLSALEVTQRLETTGVVHTEHTSIDTDRGKRCGYPEVVFGQGKSVEAIAEIFRVLHSRGDSCLATLVSAEKGSELQKLFLGGRYNPIGRTFLWQQKDLPSLWGKVAVITAGTSDRPIAEEALDTLAWMRCQTELIVDVGVAGPHRLVEQRERFVNSDAIVVVAGMEGALPSVVGGHVSCPVIAVPTSVGYGASFGGLAALLGMLNSCASNVTVVNIDSGFKGGYVAGLIAQRVEREGCQK